MLSAMKIFEGQPDGVDDTLRQMWISSIQEGSISVLPSEENSNKWVKFVRESLSKNKSLLLIARIGSTTVGYLLANISADYMFDVSDRFYVITYLFVLPEFRRKGIGTRLVNECLERTKTKGFTSARLHVLPENDAATKLYEKLGFRIFMHAMARNLL
jgi:ribosomal protein S18 acetylase RimI-like enzyme